MSELRDIAIGTTADRHLVKIDVRFYVRDGEMQTVEHEQVTSALGFACSATSWPNYGRARDCDQAGQCVYLVLEVEKFCDGWDCRRAERLEALWRRWHLNDMKAGCAHMRLPKDTSYDARKDIVCPETGYKYGRSWLVEPLPADVLAEIEVVTGLVVPVTA